MEKNTNPIFGVVGTSIYISIFDVIAFHYVMRPQIVSLESFFKKKYHPVEQVTWNNADKYCRTIKKRLPTEAEWEYAARDKAAYNYPWGDEIDSSKAKYDSGDGSGESTVPVGSYSANAFGVYDTVGNVEEWVEDCIHGTYKDAPIDGSAWLSASGDDCVERVLRGGSRSSYPRIGQLRSADRDGFNATARDISIGFRISRTLSQ